MKRTSAISSNAIKRGALAGLLQPSPIAAAFLAAFFAFAVSEENKEAIYW